MCVVLLLVKEGQVQGVHKHTARGQRLRHTIKHCEDNHGQLDLQLWTQRRVWKIQGKKGCKFSKDILRNNKEIRNNWKSMKNIYMALCVVDAAFCIPPAYQYVHVCVCVEDICRFESHALHILTCSVLTALRNGMGKLSPYNARTDHLYLHSENTSLCKMYVCTVCPQSLRSTQRSHRVLIENINCHHY